MTGEGLFFDGGYFMIRKLILQNFRIFDGAELSFDDSSSVIFKGGNGEGKTSLLESIYFLATLRSFRTQKIQEMRKMGSSFFRIESRVEKRKNLYYTLETRGLDKNSSSSPFPVFSKELYIDHTPVYRASDFTGRLPIVAFLPEDPEILTGSSLVRRRFFDMFCASVDKGYMELLQSYSQALRSRNFLLKKGRVDKGILNSYQIILARTGCQILEKRNLYCMMLEEKIREILKEIRRELSDFTIRCRLHKEAADEESYREKLEQDLPKDLQRGYTSFGPHLDDFELSANEKNLKQYASRGQLRMCSFAIKMGLFSLIRCEEGENTDKKVICLVDDVLGDLDKAAKESFFSRVSGKGQIFYTFTDIPGDDNLKESRVFFIENGKIMI